VAAVGSIAGAGNSLAAAMDHSVPQAVTVPIGPDPIYAVIEQHRKAAREHIEAVRVQFAYDEGERLEEYRRLVALADVAWGAMADAGCTLVNTRPTTLAAVRRDRSAGPARPYRLRRERIGLYPRSVRLCDRPRDRGIDEGGADMSTIIEFPIADKRSRKAR
jgi:hypothetical protein